MSDQDANEPFPSKPDAPLELRQGPGAFAWISLALLVLAVVALVYASVVGAYGSAIVSIFAVLVLSLPTLILMAVWIEVQVDNRKAIRRYESDMSSITQNR